MDNPIPESNGHIIITEYPLPLGGYCFSYDWQGGKIVQITSDVLNEAREGTIRRSGAIWRVGPYRLIELEHLAWRDVYVLSRLSPHGVMLYIRQRWYNWRMDFMARVKLTAKV